MPSLCNKVLKAAASSFLDKLNCQTWGDDPATSFRLRVRTLGLFLSSCSTSLRANGPTTILVFLLTCCLDRKSTRLNSSHVKISYAVFCLKKKNSCDAG